MNDVWLAGGAIALGLLIAGLVGPRLNYHVTLTRGGVETVNGPLAIKDCLRQVEQAQFIDNHIHYCRLNKERGK